MAICIPRFVSLFLVDVSSIQISEAKELLNAGIITADEFAQLKSKALA